MTKVNVEELEEKLENLICNMDVPAHRKATKTIHNYKWLYKNLAVMNKGNKNFIDAMNILEILVKEKK